MSLAADKHLLRRSMRARRHTFAASALLPPPTLTMLPQAIVARIDAHLHVALYIAQGDELSPAALLAGYHARHATLALPWHADRTSAMQFVRWVPGNAVERGPFGTAQPVLTGTVVAPDIIFCPLLAYDRDGGRLGQGGGHYDAAFARFPEALRLGLAWSCQLIDAVPREPHDVALHGVLTERDFTATAAG